MDNYSTKDDNTKGENSGIDDSGLYNFYDQEKAGKSAKVSYAIIVTAAIVVVLAGIQAASVLVGPLLLALFFAVILLVPLRWLQNHGCPQILAFLFVLICTISLFVGITYFVGQSLNVFIYRIPEYRDKVVEKYAELKLEELLEKYGFSPDWVTGQTEQEADQSGQEQTEGAEPAHESPPEGETISPQTAEAETPLTSQEELTPEEIIDEQTLHEGIETVLSETALSEATLSEVTLSETLPETDVSETDDASFPPIDRSEEVIALVRQIEEDPEVSLISISPQTVTYWLARAALYMRDMLSAGFLVLLFTIFMLFEASHFPRKVGRAFGDDGPINIKHFHRIAEDIRRYLFLKTVSNLMSGSAAMAVYFMFGVHGALFWGIIAFFMYYIPNIGGTLAAVVPGILIFMLHDIYVVLLYAVCLLVIECAIAYGIEPKLLGHGLRLSTLVIILSLFFWGFLLGPIGLFLAAPLTVMIKIILQAFPETRWVSIFLDGSHRTSTLEKHTTPPATAPPVATPPATTPPAAIPPATAPPATIPPA